MKEQQDFDFFAWRDRMNAYAEDRIPIDVKIHIAHNVIKSTIPDSTDEDALLYFDSEFQPNTNEIEKSLRYANIENELRMMFDGELKQDEWKKRARAHHEGLVPILLANFNQDEITDFLMGMQVDDMILDTSAALWLVVGESLWGRRIRNAYLPSIISLLSVDPETGKFEDISHNLFDGSNDAVDTVNKLLGKKD